MRLESENSGKKGESYLVIRVYPIIGSDKTLYMCDSVRRGVQKEPVVLTVEEGLI